MLVYSHGLDSNQEHLVKLRETRIILPKPSMVDLLLNRLMYMQQKIVLCVTNYEL